MAFQGDSIFWVEVEKIVPNPFQPRREFDEDKLKELSDSIRMYGVLQPLTVTRKEVQRTDGTFYTQYELIAGERRLRASKMANLSQVPVIIREGEDNEQEKLELAIIENLQREDLNAVDRALAFKQLAETFKLSHTQVARKVGRSREYVSNSVRLLALPDYMLTALKRGEMTEGHARTLLMLNDRPEEQDVVFREILLKKLSVRELEKIVRKIAVDKIRKKDPADFDENLIEMEKKFTETLGTRVQIQKTDYGGKLTIDYFSVEDLEGMLAKMKIDKKLSDVGDQTASHNSLSEHTGLNFAESVTNNNDHKPNETNDTIGDNRRELNEREEDLPKADTHLAQQESPSTDLMNDSVPYQDQTNPNERQSEKNLEQDYPQLSQFKNPEPEPESESKTIAAADFGGVTENVPSDNTSKSEVDTTRLENLIEEEKQHDTMSSREVDADSYANKVDNLADNRAEEPLAESESFNRGENQEPKPYTTNTTNHLPEFNQENVSKEMPTNSPSVEQRNTYLAMEPNREVTESAKPEEKEPYRPNTHETSYHNESNHRDNDVNAEVTNNGVNDDEVKNPPTPRPQPKPEKDEDDSGLYSVKNFSV